MPSELQDGNEMVARYKETGDKALRNDIVLFYGNIIKYAAISTKNMYQKFAETSDIINEATIALIAALESFDVARNVKFETYASIKMRGAIIDYIRRQDIIPRSVRRFIKELDLVFNQLYSEIGREPTTDEIASRLNITTEKLNKLMADSSGAASLSFEEIAYEGTFDVGTVQDDDGNWDVERGIYVKERNGILAGAIDTLNQQQRLVVSLYYYEKLKFSDIAKVMQVSES
ncbi:MAG: sigma-70 family RNA polymerase sigma factor, partial [Oscillospiraceae bacterium]